MAYWLFFLFLVFHLHGVCSVEDEVKQSLMKFLQQLTSSNGRPIDPNFGWNMSTDPCDGEWKGVTCNNLSTSVKKIVLDNLNLAGSLDAESLCSVPSLTVLSLNNNSITGTIPQEIGNCKQLTHFYASGNRFADSLPGSFQLLINLKRLVISNNNLSGELPDLPRISGLITFLAENNQLSGAIPDFNFINLQQFNVSFNNFSGPVPYLDGRFNASSLLGNPALCGTPLSNPCPAPAPVKNKSKGVSAEKALLYSGYALIGLVFLVVLAYIKIKRNKKKKGKTNGVKKGGTARDSSSKRSRGSSSDNKSPASRSEYSISSTESAIANTSLVVLTSPVVKGLRFEDLLKAPAELLGRGKHGSLYKVMLESGTTLAVKRIKDWAISGEDFKKRMERIDKVRHQNVLPAVAFYCSKEEKLLVYEFQHNGSLFRLLHGSQNGQTFDCNSRLTVAASIADALAYMHEGFLAQGIAHGNIKSSNILFDKNMDPCISEYGLMVVDNHDSLSVTNTTGYKGLGQSKDNGDRGFKIDIYGFGVILLELLTGKLVQSNGSELARWVHSVVREEWTVEVFDKALVLDGANEETMVNLLQVALKCINPSPEDRPTMNQVAVAINTIKDKDESSIVSYS